MTAIIPPPASDFWCYDAPKTDALVGDMYGDWPDLPVRRSAFKTSRASSTLARGRSGIHVEPGPELHGQPDGASSSAPSGPVPTSDVEQPSGGHRSAA